MKKLRFEASEKENFNQKTENKHICRGFMKIWAKEEIFA